MRPAPVVPGPEFLALQDAVAGRFSLVRELGRGGMGVVFLARDLALDRLVAIKLLPPHLATVPASRDRFLREARTAAGLAHPNIVPIHAVESCGNVAFFVMGYVEGETLDQRVRRLGPLSAAETQRVIHEVAWALAHAHARGVVHRDVKPENVMIEEESGRAIVTDFGIAQVVGRVTGDEEAVPGTAAYISPEVALGGMADARSDMYSLAVTAWVAATGRLPYAGDSTAALLLAHVGSPVPRLADAAPGVPSRFAAAIDTCLAKQPDQRWPSLDAFAAEVAAARAQPPVIPATQRAFLREWDRAGSEVGIAVAAAFVAAANAAGLTLWDLARGTPDRTSILRWVFVLIIVLASLLGTARLLQAIVAAITLRRRGVDHRGIVAALDREALALVEERAAAAQDALSRRPPQGWFLAETLVGGAACLALSLSDGPVLLSFVGIAGSVVLPMLAVRTSLRLIAHREPESWWRRVLRGFPGRWLLRARDDEAANTAASAALEGPAPTAVALGIAALDLLEALPAEIKRELEPDLSPLIRALEARATGPCRTAERGDRRGEADDEVGALEALRLELLRLSVSTQPAPRLTEAIARVRELGRAVDELLDAKQAVAPAVLGKRVG